jgi:hypothetical protein
MGTRATATPSSLCFAVGYHILRFQGRIAFLPLDNRIGPGFVMPQRSPIIFWLLFAATLSVDAITFSWAATEPDYSYGSVAFYALTLGQISVVCIWSGLSSAKAAWSRLVPFLAVIVACLAWGMFSFEHFNERSGFQEWVERVSSALVYHGHHAALLLAMLWAFKRTTFWKQRTGSSAEWKFSIADLLLVTTVVAMLGAGLRLTNVFLDWSSIGFLGSSVVLALASVFLWSLAQPRVIRFAVLLGFAILLGLAVSLTFGIPDGDVILTFEAHFLIHAIVLAIWLSCVPVLPQHGASAVAS